VHTIPLRNLHKILREKSILKGKQLRVVLENSEGGEKLRQ
jgi:hypothetical protein